MGEREGLGVSREGPHRQQVDVQRAWPPPLFGGPSASLCPLYHVCGPEENVRGGLGGQAKHSVQEWGLGFVRRGRVGLGLVHGRNARHAKAIALVQALGGPV